MRVIAPIYLYTTRGYTCACVDTRRHTGTCLPTRPAWPWESDPALKTPGEGQGLWAVTAPAFLRCTGTPMSTTPSKASRLCSIARLFKTRLAMPHGKVGSAQASMQAGLPQTIGRG